MPRQEAGKDVIAAARAIADREGDPLALIEFFDLLGMNLRHCQRGVGQDDNGQSFEHVVLLVHLAIIRDLQTIERKAYDRRKDQTWLSVALERWRMAPRMWWTAETPSERCYRITPWMVR